MADTIKDGGPAFPYDYSTMAGMSLRDYFAGQVIAGSLSHMDDCGERWVVNRAYVLADAMLAHREQGNG